MTKEELKMVIGFQKEIPENNNEKWMVYNLNIEDIEVEKKKQIERVANKIINKIQKKEYLNEVVKMQEIVNFGKIYTQVEDEVLSNELFDFDDYLKFLGMNFEEVGNFVNRTRRIEISCDLCIREKVRDYLQGVTK